MSHGLYNLHHPNCSYFSLDWEAGQGKGIIYIGTCMLVVKYYVHTFNRFGVRLLKGSVNYKEGKPLSLLKIFYSDLLNERF